MADDKEIQRFEPVSLMPQTFEQKFKMAGVLCRSGLLPQGLSTPEKVCVALEWGHELQLPPMVAVNNIAVINGKPTLSVDIMAAVVKRSPEYGGIEWTKATETEMECVVSRILPNGKIEKTVSRFTIDDAMTAGLTGKDVWKKYQKRMLKHRCLSYGLRDAFPDILAGLYSPEEIESVPGVAGEEERNVTPVTETEVHDAQEVTDEADVQPQDGEQTVVVSEIALKLDALIEEHAMDLQGKPYKLARDCLKNPASTEDDYRQMYGRVVTYLGKKGIKVN